MAANDANLKVALDELGLSVLTNAFARERVDDETAMYLTDGDLVRLGIETIGDRHRFRAKMKNCRTRREQETFGSAGRIVRQVNESLHGQQRTNLFNHSRGFGHTRSNSRKKLKANRFTGWTANFYCLSSNSTNHIPSASEKEILRKAGFGLKKIRLENCDDEETVIEKIMCSDVNDENEVVGFPQLREAGGIELMRTAQNCRDLRVIGFKWTSKELKCNIGSQARIYIRPVQKSLPLQPITSDESLEEGQCFSTCKNCNEKIPMRQLRQHIESCTNTEMMVSEQYPTTEEFTEAQYIPLGQLQTLIDTSEQLSALATGSDIPHTITTDQLQTLSDTSEQFSALATGSNIPHTIITDQLQTPNVTTEFSSYPTGSDILHTIATDQLLPSQSETTDQSGLPALPLTTYNTEQLLLPINDDSELPVEPKHPVKEIVQKVVNFCREKDILNPVEILKKMQNDVVTGRDLDIIDVNSVIVGDTNYIIVDREDILQTGFEELENKTEMELRNTLEVQFYAEVAEDYGGPRKEFFKLILTAIKEKYFDNGLRELLADDYRKVGVVFALSILQNGKMPCFMNEEVLMELWDTSKSPSPCIKNLRIGMDTLGIFELVTELPSLQFLFHKKTTNLTVKKLLSVLQPTFSEAGSNRHTFEKTVYSKFVKYIREVASGRREGITLPSILQFVTGTDEEPVLGFTLQPTLEFCEVRDSFIPTSNTCINRMILPRPTTSSTLPTEEKLFELYDYAFSNWFYGLK